MSATLIRRVAQAARAKAVALRTDPGWRQRFAHPYEQAFALDHFASDLEAGLWSDWLPREALSDPPAVEPATMRLWCYGCGRDVSTPVPMGTIVRAWIQCPACMERWQPTPEEPAVEPVTACVGEVRDHENDGPLESTDLYVTGRGVSLLVNAVAGNRFTYALSVDGHDVQSGEVGAEEPAVEPREGDQRVRGTVREVWCVDCGSWEFDGHVQAVDPVPSSVWDAFRELDAAVVEWDRRDCDAEAPLIRENRVWSRIRRAVDIYRQAAQEPAAVPVQEQE